MRLHGAFTEYIDHEIGRMIQAVDDMGELDNTLVFYIAGDNRTSAEAVARRLGIDEVKAEVLPEDKGDIVAAFRAEGRVVAMAGDGANDAPALAAADVGLLMI